MKYVAVSGYFTVLHKGHVKLFKEARELGDALIVILNNNEQQIAKKGKLIHDVEDIKYIIQEFECVDEVIIAGDKDSTVCKTLELVEPHIFANGGDRFEDNVPEKAVCEELDIEMVFNVGGEKTNSSTDILKKGETNGRKSK